MAGFLQELREHWEEGKNPSVEPLTGEGDAGFGMRLTVENLPRPKTKFVEVKVQYAPANMYATLMEQICRKANNGDAEGAAQPWLVNAFPDGTFVMFHIASATWHKVRFAVAGKQYIRKAWASSGARILLEIVPSPKQPYDLTLNLWNPVSGAVSTLPTLQGICNPCAFCVGRDRVVGAGTDRHGANTWVEMYTSGAKSWQVLGHLPRPYCIRMDPIVEYKGSYYVLLIYPDHHMLEIKPEGPNHLSVCQTPKVWKPILAVCKSGLYMVGLTPDDDVVRIWKLRDETQSWELLCEPKSPISDPEREVYSLITVGNTLIFYLKNNLIMTYSVAKFFWGYLPVCPLRSLHAFNWLPSPNDDFA